MMTTVDRATVEITRPVCCEMQCLGDAEKVRALGELCDRIERCQIPAEDARAELTGVTDREERLILNCLRRRLLGTCDIPRNDRYQDEPKSRPGNLGLARRANRLV